MSGRSKSVHPGPCANDAPVRMGEARPLPVEADRSFVDGFESLRGAAGLDSGVPDWPPLL
ncbi:hypothetical protein GCM10009577_02610 [Streptomyces javensis]